MKFSIPTPCHEDWNKMTPKDKGRHCDSCAKTVVDFSVMNDNEVNNYLKDNQHKKLCGRAKPSQLHTPAFTIKKIPNWARTFAYASFMAFGLSLYSCKTHDDQVVGELVMLEEDTITSCQKNEDDTASIMVGQVAIWDTVVNQPDEIFEIGEIAAEPFIKGDVAIDPVIDIQKDSVCVKDTVFDLPISGNISYTPATDTPIIILMGDINTSYNEEEKVDSIHTPINLESQEE